MKHYTLLLLVVLLFVCFGFMNNSKSGKLFTGHVQIHHGNDSSTCHVYAIRAKDISEANKIFKEATANYSGRRTTYKVWEITEDVMFPKPKSKSGIKFSIK